MVAWLTAGFEVGFKGLKTCLQLLHRPPSSVPILPFVIRCIPQPYQTQLQYLRPFACCAMIGCEIVGLT
eukprot:COSAG02_NODE_50933_length_317_cov_0.944954_1_plen_68_part_10